MIINIQGWKISISLFHCIKRQFQESKVKSELWLYHNITREIVCCIFSVPSLERKWCMWTTYMIWKAIFTLTSSRFRHLFSSMLFTIVLLTILFFVLYSQVPRYWCIVAKMPGNSLMRLSLCYTVTQVTIFCDSHIVTTSFYSTISLARCWIVCCCLEYAYTQVRRSELRSPTCRM